MNRRRILLAFACAGVLLAPRDVAADRASEDSLFGLWATRLDFGPAIRGELLLERRPAGWRATIAGQQVSFVARGDSVHFALPHDLGAFRGVPQGADIEGYWLQPSGETEDRRDPGGSGQRFATPVTLRASGAGRWKGAVQPLDDHFTLYLKIDRNQSDVLFAAFRNPEMNSNGGRNLFRVFREGDSVWFASRPDTASPYQRLVRASLARSPERIRVFWPDLGRVVELGRREVAKTTFLPRAPEDTIYTYRPPPATNDGWTTARARDVGMDEGALARLVQRLIRTDPATSRPPLVHSLLVAHRGKLVLEEYFYGYGRDTAHDIRSAGKTLGSVMLGAAILNGVDLGGETPVYATLAARGPFAHPDPRKARITLGHLLTHTAGLACDDNNDASPGNEGTMQSQRGQPDWWKYTLDLPMAHEPGVRYAYCSANSNLVGAVLTATTDTWLPELFARTLARPLQFGRWHWNLMPNDEGYLGGGAFLRPRDLLKVGQLFLDGGRWKGRRLVDSSWVRISTSAHARISPATTGIDSSQFGEFYGEADEGYAWHLTTLHGPDRNYAGYCATGNGGQILMVIPEVDLTVVFTAGNYGHGGIWGRFGDQFIAQEIIPAMRR